MRGIQRGSGGLSVSKCRTKILILTCLPVDEYVLAERQIGTRERERDRNSERYNSRPIRRWLLQGRYITAGILGICQERAMP